MVSVFPSLLDFDLLATFVLRVALGLTFLGFAYTIFAEKNRIAPLLVKVTSSARNPLLTTVAFLHLILGLALTVGVFTQIVGVVGGVFMTIAAGIKLKHPELLPRNTLNFYLVLAVASFAFISFGSGVFAVDLPL